MIGLGLGPGNPELLTLRAVRLLREADAVFVPGKLAAQLVAPYRTATILPFPMTDDEEAIERCLHGNADRIAAAARDGIAIFALLGDPNFFSTFSRLCTVMAARHPDICCRAEPGVSAITACAAVAGIPISNSFIVSDGSEPSAKIFLKVRKPRETVEKLRHEGYLHFVLVERIFLDNEKVYREEEFPETSDYLSIMVAWR
ncbi:MAG: cobalt-factor II C(20)-methyltransferase [Methanomicrobiales archaeon]|nr:cobalt-factor II C(20)-methyltransferase [Methanomicrobiales archaeon]